MEDERVTYLGTGIASLDAAKRYLKNKWNQGALEPIVVRPGARFYVTLRAGRRTAFLLGPYVSHMTALASVRRAKRLLGDRGTFAAIGTASTLDTRPTVYGR